MKTSLVAIISAVVWTTATFKVSEAIINGRKATAGKHPYQVAVFNEDSFICGGSIISDTWVLTAAHCVYNESSISVKTGIDLRNLTQPKQEAVAVIVHEGYLEKVKDDIALLKVSPAFTWSSEVGPIALVEGTWELPPHEVAELSGFGRQANGTYDPYLETTTVKLDQMECSRFVGIYFDPHRQLCTFGSTGACLGDSGGPLTSQGFQIGIAAHVVRPITSQDPCEPSYFTIYTRVSAYSDWIQEKCDAYDGEIIAKLVLEWLGVVVLGWFGFCVYWFVQRSRSKCKIGSVTPEVSSVV